MFSFLGFIFWSALCGVAGSMVTLYNASHSRKFKKVIDDAYAKAEANGEVKGVEE